MKLWKAGKLKDAILAFEAEAQKNKDNAEAWRCIGEVAAENEDEHGYASQRAAEFMRACACDSLLVCC